jgi:hypothetical protein
MIMGWNPPSYETGFSGHEGKAKKKIRRILPSKQSDSLFFSPCFKLPLSNIRLSDWERRDSQTDVVVFT